MAMYLDHKNRSFGKNYHKLEILLTNYGSFVEILISVIRQKSEKSGSNFDVHLNRQFNYFIQDRLLVEQKLHTRKYTWNNGTHFALLDRFFYSIDWDLTYPDSTLTNVRSIVSYHCPMILQTNLNHANLKPPFKFDPI